MLKFVWLFFIIFVGDQSPALCKSVMSKDVDLPQSSDDVSTSTENFGIVGGHDIDITKAPYQIALYVDGIFQCGGSIIEKDLIVTAAHCLFSRTNNYVIRAGSSKKDKGGITIKAKKSKAHENYDSDTNQNDIGLVWLEEPLEFNDKIKAIALDDDGFDVENGALMTVTGWGRTTEDGEDPSTLQSVQVPKVDLSTCKNDYEEEVLTSLNLCAGYPDGGKDSCQGDSGGPLVYNNKLSGIVSWGVGCAEPHLPGVYTRVAALRKWIDQNTKIDYNESVAQNTE